MSDLIDILQKKIYKNKPESNMYSQYNFGRVTQADFSTLMGRDLSNTSLDLYTTVYTRPNQIRLWYPDGHVRGVESTLTITKGISQRIADGKNPDTDDGKWGGPIFATYFYDGAEAVGKNIFESPSSEAGDLQYLIGTDDGLVKHPVIIDLMCINGINLVVVILAM